MRCTHAHMQQQLLHARVQAICDETSGGRALLSGGAAVVRVIDCPRWTARATAMLRASHPDALLSIEPCSISLSGFLVRIAPSSSSTTTSSTTRRRCWAAVACCVVALLLVLGGSSLTHRLLLIDGHTTKNNSTNTTNTTNTSQHQQRVCLNKTTAVDRRLLLQRLRNESRNTTTTFLQIDDNDDLPQRLYRSVFVEPWLS